MSDLFQGQTMTYAASYIADGGAYTFTIPFKPDRISVTNYTNVAVYNWYLGMPAASAVQVDAGTKMTTNGFTVADTSGGMTSYSYLIDDITQADPCVVTTPTAHGYSTGDIVRFSDLGDIGAVDRGMDQLNNNRYKIVVLTTTTFSLKDVITGEDIDSTSFDAYVSGGYVLLESRYGDTKYEWAPVDYKITFGTGVAGADSDVVYFECIKFGEYESIGDIDGL